MSATFTLNFFLSGLQSNSWGYFYTPGLINFGVFKVRYVLFRVKSGNFRHQVNSDSDLVCCIFYYWNKRNKLIKQIVKMQMRRLIRSRLIWISTFCKCMSEFTQCPKLPDFTLLFFFYFSWSNAIRLYPTQLRNRFPFSVLKRRIVLFSIYKRLLSYQNELRATILQVVMTVT